MNSFGFFNWLAVMFHILGLCMHTYVAIDINYISKSIVLTPWSVGDLYRTVYKLAIELSV